MAEIQTHTLLYCRISRCHSLLVVQPGAWVIVRALQKGENAREGHGAAQCRCGVKWEYTQVQQREAA